MVSKTRLYCVTRPTGVVAGRFYREDMMDQPIFTETGRSTKKVSVNFIESSGLGTITFTCYLFKQYIQNISEALIQFRVYGSSTLYTHKYSHFHIDNEKSKYMMHVSGVTYNGHSASYFTSYNNKMEFSTKDSDNDQTSSYHCARRCYGGWWYNGCSNPFTNLNGEYNSLKKNSWVYSFSWYGTHLEFSEMKMRRVVWVNKQMSRYQIKITFFEGHVVMYSFCKFIKWTNKVKPFLKKNQFYIFIILFSMW